MAEEITYCVRGCTDGHLSDCTEPDCRGCQPRLAELGLLCRPCHNHLVSLAGPTVPIEDAETGAESVATITAWLATNLGQHLRGRSDNGGARVESMDRTVDVAVAMSDLQIKLCEWAASFAGRDRLDDTDPDNVAQQLRRWLWGLARWEPVGEMIDDLREAIDQAHAVAPWRPRDRRCIGVACPTCRHKTLRIPAGEIDVRCDTCGAVHGRETYDRLTALMAWEAHVEQRLARAGLTIDAPATLDQLHHALEVPRETLRRWRKDTGAMEPIACVVADRSLQYATRDAVVLATRYRRA